MAVRVLSFTPAPISVRSRSVTTVSVRLYHHPINQTVPSLFQRRFASDQAQTQSEPEADGATEAQHGENSIAASLQEKVVQKEEEPVEKSSAFGDLALGVGEPEQIEPSNSAEHPETTFGEQAAEYATSAKEQAAEYGQAATEAVSGVASSAAQSTGLGKQQNSDASMRLPDDSSQPSNVVYIGNLFFDATDEDLRREFSKVGEVVSATVKTDARGLSRG